MTTEAVLTSLRRAAGNTRHAETSSWVAAQLRQAIADGRLAPGAKLAEEELREALGVSRNTLREAFATLTTERVVTRIPNRGVFVSHPTAEDIREIYRVRRLVEPGALLWSPAQPTQALAGVVRTARAAAAAGDVPAMADANQEFHRGIVARAGSERLSALMEQVLAEMRLVFATMGADPRFHEPYVEENAKILGLLEAGRNAQAAEAMAQYLNRAEHQLLEAIGG
ncbi:GntR family transcriptional regulator [Sinomonas atrocyanea]|uniref:GntR family transcriptional regulator n=1 Tax=Sinomonas atrocyanea TaxID=37927 RepID=A0A127A4S9_9MICC|nr:GntR family transcriptional regulator [Sinomonas atrocyanea]AMM34157.1 GntR family transcriptional regulator [Sinomonas atrocyanea]GEB65140.1 GntR family transcriptional regulator [Sinomonas atrocyanea]GGG75589.1 GntR family transcriptional regulator [Sinomonas atrocyanea]